MGTICFDRRTMRSVAGHFCPSGLRFLCQRFSSLVCNVSLSVPRPAEQSVGPKSKAANGNLPCRSGQPPLLKAIRIPSPLGFVKRAIRVLLDVPPELGRETRVIEPDVKLLDNVFGNLVCVHLFPVFP